MISIKKKVDCCGCNACGDICPKGVITFQTDKEGFWYPKVDTDNCIDCKLCEQVCPTLNKSEIIIRYKEPLVYAAYNKNNDIRMDSTSGGIHSALSEYIFAQGGYVGGAIYNEDHTVSHITTGNPARLDEIRSSKYLQSSMAGQYKEIKKLLNSGKTVFYCAAPCQIQALYKYLKKDYDNLITSDFICRGVNSPKVFLSYIKMLEHQFESKATSIKFKYKKWGWHNFSTRVIFSNGKEYCKDRDHDMFLIGYLQYGNFARPSCYECQFKGFPQKADITLADFWGIEQLDTNMDQDKGTSLVMINSAKGLNLFNHIKNHIVWKEFTMSDAKIGNKAIDSSLKTVYDNRDLFFDAIDNKPFQEVAKEFFPIRSPWQWFIYNVKVTISNLIKKIRQ
ncbi:MAG: Coenzyme F420 hydrogenase/dehydrogenase, beta subunit C-terminal domain [Muribaculaceae bacterium]|nr:Coenzyme F420 hydrogenase/dehydrogenase, beta subunit C-terminal domain [Muribaculaceae bacterium]